MIDFFQKIVRAGIDEQVTAEDSKFIMRCNFITLIALFLIPFYGVLFYTLGATTYAYFMSVVFLCFLCVFLFNKVKSYHMAKLWLLGLLASCVYVYGSALGKGASVHYLFFVFIPVPFLLFHFEQMTYLALSLLLYLITFFAMEHEWYHMKPVLDDSGQHLVHDTIITISIFWSLVNYLYYEVTNREVAHQLKENYDELKAKNKELEQFAYIAAHDLQEPLRTVINFSTLLEKKYKDTIDGEGKTYLGYLVNSSMRMRALIKGLLDYSTLGHDMHLKRVDMNLVAQQVIANLESTIAEAGAEIIVDELPQLNGYETNLRILLDNLISNAIKYRRIGVKPKIHIGAERKNKEWEFTVRDNGIGFNEAYADKLFIIFQQLHGRNQYEGTGMGLAFCRKIVELHRGRIWAKGKEGEGSTFYFTIPDLKL